MRLPASLACSPIRPTVGRWRRRFAERGIAELGDAPRPGKPVKHGARLQAQLELAPPAAGHGHSWDGGSLALWRIG